jgi:TRAP-type C4-dicarboxylate transport system substrate-binding protein
MAHAHARAAAAFCATLVFTGAALGCSHARVDKAGGTAPVKPLVLTLATHDEDYAYGSFAAAVARLSGGSMRVKIATNWRGSDIQYERGIVRDVRRGRVPLGIVGVRVWDTLGVPSFQALVAPFLIESVDIEGRALRSGLGRRALGAVSRRGVVGIALLPGLLRRPFGITRPLVRPRDYRSATIGIRPGGVAKATFAVLGGIARGNTPSDPSGLDGAELDLLTITSDVWDSRGRALTGNVVFWPKAQTIVMNRAAFDRLTSEQREILRRAGRDAFEPELRRDRRDERYEPSLLCSTVSVVTATPAERAALRRSVERVYRGLERDPFTKKWITQIEQMRAQASARVDSVRCP